MDVQLAGLFWSRCGAKLKHFALKLDYASRLCVALSSPHCLLGHGTRLQEAPPTTENTAGCLSGTPAMATQRQRGSQRWRGTSFPPASDKSILWWPQRCDRVLYGRIKNRERVQMLKSCFRPQAQASRGLWEPPAALRGFRRALRFIAAHTWLN